MQASARTPMAPVFVLAQLETLINSVIRNAPATQLQLEALAGQVIGIRVTAPVLEVFIHLDGDEIRLSHHFETAPNLLIEGSAPALLKQVMAESGSVSFEGLRLKGDVTLAARLRDMARQLDFDWEDVLARYVGDVAAHQVGELVRGGVRFLREFARKAVADTRTHLVHERRMIIDRARFEQFGDAVHTLREDNDRLEARISQLRQRLAREG